MNEIEQIPAEATNMNPGTITTPEVKSALSKMMSGAEPESDEGESEESLDLETSSEELGDDLGESDEDPSDGDELQVTELTEDELNTEVLIGEETVSIRALKEAYENRDSFEVISSEREELESLKKQLETEKEQFDYVYDESKPHIFLTKVLDKMIKAGTLPEEAYSLINQVFVTLQKNKLYDPKQVEAKAAAMAEQKRIADEKNSVEAERRALKTDKEIAEVEKLYGPLTADVATKLVAYIKKQYKSNGKLLTLQEAASQNKGLFSKPAPSKRALANRLRSSPTKIIAKPEPLSAQAALKRLMKS